LGAALAGLAANVSGFSADVGSAGVAAAAFWVPTSFVVFAAAACLASLRLHRLQPAKS